MIATPPLITDSHCHLDFPDFAADIDGVIARARAAGRGMSDLALAAALAIGRAFGKAFGGAFGGTLARAARTARAPASTRRAAVSRSSTVP